jgi:glycosyltransferase involved in cell wall biosynthesis
MSESLDSPLRVGFDASAAAVPRPTGVGLGIGELARALGERAGLELEVLYRLSRAKRRAHFLPGPSRLFHSRWSFLLARSLDVFHGPDTRLPEFRGPALVATVHDFSARHPGFASDRFRATREEHWRRVQAQADLVVTYTEAVRDEVHRELGIPLERIAVCPLGPTRQSLGATEEETRAAAERHAGGAPYVLVLGELSERKNTLNAVRAFAASGLEDHRLILVGPRGHGAEGLEAEVASLGERVVRPDYLPSAEVAALLRGAQVFFFPTRYEGFGMPLLEGFAARVPVVIGDAASVVEIAGGAAKSAPSEDVEGLGRALQELSLDPQERERYVSLGQQRLRDFSWRASAERLHEIYRAAATRAPLPSWLGSSQPKEAPCSP